MADFPDDELDILPDEGQDLLPGDEEQGIALVRTESAPFSYCPI